MKNFYNRLTALTSVVVIGLLMSCGGDDEPQCDSSNPITIQTQSTVANCGVNNGSVTVAAVGGDGNYEYSVDGGSFTASSVLSGLSTGEHEVTVRDGSRCSTTTTATITSDVTFSGQVAGIIANSCAISGCHVAGTVRQNFEQLSVIQQNALDIKNRTQSGNMPRNGTLSAAEISLIACWVDDGALDN